MHRKNIRSVITIHDLIFLEHPELYKSIDRKIYKRKVHYGTRVANRIIAASQQTKKDIIRFFGVDASRIKVVYQGCDPRFYQKVSGEAFKDIRKKFGLPSAYLLYVGTIEERKNLLQAVRALDQGGIDIPLVAVGRKTAYFKEVIAYIEKNKLRNIHFLDHVQTADLPAIYQGSSGFIYPSSYEGFGIPVLEALNSGVPVITSRGGCLEETAGKGALLIDPLDPDEFQDAIKRILEDSELKESLVREGSAHALNFREEKTIPDLYKVYLESSND